jgi:hypothetical protein
MKAVDEVEKVTVDGMTELEVIGKTEAARLGVRGRTKPGLGIRLGGAVRG